MRSDRSENRNVAVILQEQGVRLGAKRAIVHGDRTITYDELARNVRRRAVWLRRRGVVVGDGVLVVVPISIDLYEILIALFHCGATAVFLDAWSDAARIEQARRAIAIDHLIAPGRVRLLRLFSPALRSIRSSLPSRLSRSFTEEMSEPVERSDDDRALVTFTTGSTGRPKGANRTHGHLREQQRAIIETFRPRAEDIDLATLPIFPLSNLAVGSTTVLPTIDFRKMAESDPQVLVDAIEKEGVTTAALSPAIFDRYVARSSSGNTSSLQRILVGGASISPSLAARALSALPSVDLVAVYGSTEAEPIAVAPFGDVKESRDDQPGRGLPAGRPIEQIELVVLRGTDSTEHSVIESEPMQGGEICVRGPHVLSSYVGDASEWEEKFVTYDEREWLRTGDAGYLDASGNLRLLGRYGRRIEVERGDELQTVWPAIFERVLEKCEGVAIGTALEMDGRIVVVIEAGGDDAVTDLAGRVAEVFAENGIPCDAIRIVENIPRDPRHDSKIDVGRLEKMLKSE